MSGENQARDEGHETALQDVRDYDTVKAARTEYKLL